MGPLFVKLPNPSLSPIHLALFASVCAFVSYDKFDSMDSPDSAYISSPEPHPKRSGVDHIPIDSEDMEEKATYIKFLVSNAEAGSVIGKGGTTITEFQTQSGARIQLSRNQEYFPGTSDRIIMVSGKINDILKAVELILNKLLTEIQYEDADDVGTQSKLRVVVPNSCCGAIIGKGGATIKSFIEESQAGIKISPQDNGYVGLSDRLVTLTGALGGQMHAVELILSKLTEDPRYLQSMNSPLSYPVGSSPYHAPSQYGPSNGAGGKFQNKDDNNNSLTIGVADEHIGVVLGRGGRSINEISQVSGARIKISDKGDFMFGTSDRKVTITGSPRAIRTAENMILQKVASVGER